MTSREPTITRPAPQGDSAGAVHSTVFAVITPLAQFQSAFGNQAWGRYLQAKLKVSRPGDQYEAEAERVADQVMLMPDKKASPAQVSECCGPTRIQRACADCEEEDEEQNGALQRKALDESDAELELQRKPEKGNDPGSSVAAQIDRLKSGGEALPDPVRNFFEPRFGRDFRHVRVHTDGFAASSARGVKALAFTTGSNIVFAEGEYSPDTSRGRHLLAHELAHTVQQGSGIPLPGSASPGLTAATTGSLVQRRTSLDEDEFGRIADDNAPPQRVGPLIPANPTASAPPSPGPVPTAPGTFDAVTGAALTARQTHGLSQEPGPMIRELESSLFPTGGANPPCNAIPAGFETTLATVLSTELQSDIPSLTPADAPDPMALAAEVAGEAMPIITTHYSPHAPSRSAPAFMANVSRRTTSAGDPIRNNPNDFAEFLEWYAGARTAVRNITADKCNLDTTWWRGFVGWLGAAGASFNGNPHRIRERCAVFDTFRTSVTQGGHIEFGRGFNLSFIPHTVAHEAMHLFQHPDLDTQINLMQAVRSSRDIIIEGFAEYLARGVRDEVVTAIQGHVPPALSAADEARARVASAYPNYFTKAVEIRDTLYRHGQDGEESIRRAFFLGEGWRFGLLESPGVGSPIETDRALPAPVDVRFATAGDAMLNPGALTSIIAYLQTRSIARVEIVGRTDTVGAPAANLTLGQQRADAVQAHLIGQGIDAARISATSHGAADQIPGGRSANRRATVTVIDPRNEFPGVPAVGRP